VDAKAATAGYGRGTLNIENRGALPPARREAAAAIASSTSSSADCGE
jgi:hypothetical protein